VRRILRSGATAFERSVQRSALPFVIAAPASSVAAAGELITPIRCQIAIECRFWFNSR
jgi:hypothetical protein